MKSPGIEPDGLLGKLSLADWIFLRRGMMGPWLLLCKLLMSTDALRPGLAGGTGVVSVLSMASAGAVRMGCSPTPDCDVSPGDSKWFRDCCLEAGNDAVCALIDLVLSRAGLLGRAGPRGRAGLHPGAVFDAVEVSGEVLIDIAHIHSWRSLADSAAKCVLWPLLSVKMNLNFL